MLTCLSDRVLDHVRGVGGRPDLFADEIPARRAARARRHWPVYAVEDTALGREVSLKVRRRRARRGASASACVREARILARLEHPASSRPRRGHAPDGASST